MKTVSKKLLSLLLVVLLLAAAVPFQAFADEVEYKVKITIQDDSSDEYIGVVVLDVSTTSPATKSAVDQRVSAKMNLEANKAKYPDGYSIVSYTATAGSPLLTDWEVLPGDVTAITVRIKSNTPPAPADYITLTLDAGAGASIGSSGSTTAITIEKNAEGKYLVPTLPTASKSGYTFLGWFVGENQLENGEELTGNTTATAKYQLITKNIKVKGVKTTQSLESAWLITEFNATTGNNLLDFLKTNATASVQSNTPTGYQLVTSGGSIQWYNYTGSTTLTGQEQITSAAQEVLVKYQPKTFTLYFQVEGGTVDPTSKTVTYDSAVGTLPTPTRTGDVFLGWFDEAGNQYTADTVYKVDGNTTLTARWQNEALVLLRIYRDDKTSTPDRIVDITGKVVGNSVSRTEVEAIVTKYYTGSSMKLVGLFSDATWASYKAGSITEGTPNVTIQETAKTNIHVVVKNASNSNNSTTSTTSSTTATTKPADKDNPKTGDSMLIYTASAVMIVAAAALVVIQVLRKKRTF
ncbi:MAG: InlB B-repeat-containing protein [Faecousia sp.]